MVELDKKWICFHSFSLYFFFLYKNSADHLGDASQKILQPGADLELINSLFFLIIIIIIIIWL